LTIPIIHYSREFNYTERDATNNLNPAGFKLLSEISHPSEPMTPPLATIRAVPFCVNQAVRKASSGICAWSTVTILMDERRTNKLRFINFYFQTGQNFSIFRH
ncbi:MAG: hypothetical protein ACKOOA_00195, partial [Sediminibacterium sp.]